MHFSKKLVGHLSDLMTSSIFRLCNLACYWYFSRISFSLLKLIHSQGNYQMILGRPNSAYLLVGNAVRKAQAAGLHRLPPSPPTPRTRERTITYWSLYCLENVAAYCFGRPLALCYNTSSTPLPANQPMIHTIVSLSRMMTRCSDEIYNRPRSDRSLSKLYRSAHSIRSEVLAFTSSLAEPLRWGPIKPGAQGVQQCLTYCVSQHIILLTFRPFLLFRAMLDSSERQCVSSKTGRVDAEKMGLLMEGCRLCVDTAQNFVMALIEAAHKNPLIRDMGYTGFHLEGATFVVVYALLLRDSLGEEEGWREKCMEVLEIAAGYLTDLEVKYPNWFPLKTASDAVKRMVEMLKRLHNADRETSSQSVELSESQRDLTTSGGPYPFQTHQQQHHQPPYPQSPTPLPHVSQDAYFHQSQPPIPVPPHSQQHQISTNLPPLLPWACDPAPPFSIDTLADISTDAFDGAGSVNFDFGFDMTDMDLEMFLNQDTPGGSVYGAVEE